MTPADIWSNPVAFPVRIVLPENKVVFVPLSQQLYETVAFLDDRYIPMSGSREIPLDVLKRTAPVVAKAERRPVHCMFHVAFCGSTLISRCLDRLSGALVLKEPLSFHEIAFEKRHGSSTAAHGVAWQTAFELLMALLGRTFHPDQVAIVKPTDASTHLLGDVLAYADASAALFLYVGLEEFLLSVMGDEVRRGFVRERLEDLSVLCGDHPLVHGENWRALTDAEQAACLWLLHVHVFVEFAARHPAARCRSLDFRTFLGDPVAALAALARLFGIAAPPHEIEAAIVSETGIHSKERKTRFTVEDRARALRSVSEKYGDEIRVGLAWAERRLAHPFPEALPLPLDLES